MQTALCRPMAGDVCYRGLGSNDERASSSNAVLVVWSVVCVRARVCACVCVSAALAEGEERGGGREGGGGYGEFERGFVGEMVRAHVEPRELRTRL